MRTNKLSILAALVLGGLMAGGTLATAQDAKEGKQGGKRGGPSVEQLMATLTEQLTLTDEQKPKVKAVLEDSQKKRAELRDATPEERGEKMRAMREEQNKKMKEILTPEQFAKYEKMPQRPGRPGGPGGAAPGGPAAGDTKKE